MLSVIAGRSGAAIDLLRSSARNLFAMQWIGDRNGLFQKACFAIDALILDQVSQPENAIGESFDRFQTKQFGVPLGVALLGVEDRGGAD